MLLNVLVLRVHAETSEPDTAITGSTVSGRPWTWVPTLYFAEGLPNALVAGVSVVLYKGLDVPNKWIALYTSLLYLPWVVKPLWSPVVDILSTRRRWIFWMQWLVAAALAGIAAVLPTTHAFPLSLGCFWIVALSSATHDVAADGFYMLALSEGQQSFFVGVRNTLYRAAALFASGPFIILAAELGRRTGDKKAAWAIAFLSMAVVFGGFGLYHRWVLPRPTSDRAGGVGTLSRFSREFIGTFAAFFEKPDLSRFLLFLLFYRFGEAQLLAVARLFLLDPRSAGGLGLTEDQFGLVYGTIGVIALMIGGIIGGVLVSRRGLRAWLWPMVCVMHVPDAAFIYLSCVQPENLKLIAACVAAEQFGYGFGFTAYTLYMIYIARGQHSTAHFAICTGFMALGLMVPGAWSGALQTKLGYPAFFVWTVLSTIPGFIVTGLIPLDAAFGKKSRG